MPTRLYLGRGSGCSHEAALRRFWRWSAKRTLELAPPGDWHQDESRPGAVILEEYVCQVCGWMSATGTNEAIEAHRLVIASTA